MFFQPFRFRTLARSGAALAAVTTAAACAAGPASLPATPEAWRAAAQADIEAAVRITRENHPGPYDVHNPGFSNNLEAARSHGLALAARVTDAPGYVAAVQGFNVRIRDGHAGMVSRLDSTSTPPQRWPGFVTVWRSDGLYVHSSRPGAPAVGSKLRSCDGKAAEQLIRDNVFSFQGRVDEAGQWWSRARRVFLDEHNPFVALPQRCIFEAKGTTTEHALAWRPLDTEGERWLDESNGGDAGPVGVTEQRKNLLWVSMPTFHPDEAERAAYRALYRDVETRRARWLAADAVVVDLRKNQGGSSSWSLDFAKALWGKARVAQASENYDAGVEVWWRASPDNTSYVASLAERLVREGHAQLGARIATYGRGMREALARGAPFYVEPSEAAAGAVAEPDGPPFTRPVYVIVPGNCASACLDALDVMTRFPNTVLVGAPSSADSTYMDVRVAELESGRAAVIVPNKVYVNRKRANGEIYRPQIEVRDIVWSVPTLLKAVEADLAHRRAGERTGGR
ncbi:S41 family peptidase [Massilia sp. Mn16-1_5]|uniref:S41 family peptidase n=1 Tax=Massilia sp. Mn16-1_5 TaxID=2079199 RepID=UPI00109E3A5E|nr:S41 family peptidase [Massilia sp. Mn16-1_5]THC41866.1 hypothetical protein C2862_17170 [Massilia sp. Mn16-1_5]